MNQCAVNYVQLRPTGIFS